MVVDDVGFVANLLLNDKYDAVLRALMWTPQTQMQRTKVSLRFLYLILPKKYKQSCTLLISYSTLNVIIILPVVS